VGLASEGGRLEIPAGLACSPSTTRLTWISKRTRLRSKRAWLGSIDGLIRTPATWPIGPPNSPIVPAAGHRAGRGREHELP
jgi:hypothetical protein